MLRKAAFYNKLNCNTEAETKAPPSTMFESIMNHPSKGWFALGL